MGWDGIARKTVSGWAWEEIKIQGFVPGEKRSTLWLAIDGIKIML